MPKGFLTADGPRPEFAELYGAAELPTASYPARTEQNVRDSDGTILFGDPTTPGCRLTLEWCRNVSKTSVIVEPGGPTLPSHVVAWLRNHNVRVLNVAGNRESNLPGIGEKVERFLDQVFRQLGRAGTRVAENPDRR
jgi:hypothetical protein